MYFFFTFLVFASSQNCPKYECGSLQSPLCTSGSDSTVYVQSCPIGSYCPFNASTPLVPQVCETIQIELSYPGEPCKTNSDCNINLCLTNFTCAGLPEAAQCNNTLQCNPGLYCTQSNIDSETVCTRQIQTGNIGCKDSGDCVNVAYCNWTGIPGKSRCIGALSLLPGTQISQCINNLNPVCQNLYCTTNIEGSFCADLVKSINILPVKCSSNWDCMSTTDRYVGGFYLGNCICGNNPNGNAYCSLFPGDYPYQHYLLVFSSWINSPNITNCNSLRGFTPNCVKKYFSFYTELFYYYYYANLYPQLQSNSECVKDTITYNFWDYEEILANRTIFSAGVVIEGIFSLVIYLW